MPFHKWRRKRSKHFGDVWFPYGWVDLADAGGRFHRLTVLIDSGATVTLLRRSVGELLGLDPAEGRKIELTGVGAGSTNVVVHQLLARFDGKWGGVPIPVAIADNDRVPNLLGRLGVFDALQFNFDGTLSQTVIAPAWLDMKQRVIWESFLDLDRHVISRWHLVDHSNSTREAARRMIQRAAQLFAAVAGLVQNGQTFAAPPLLRALFDLSAQFEFLMRDPTVRSQQYLEFGYVVRWQANRRYSANSSIPIRNNLSKIPDRQSKDAEIKAQYDRVISQFQTVRGVHKNWYKSHLAGLCQEIGWSVEYETLFRMLSDWMHGSPVATEETHFFKRPYDALVNCYTLYGRMLRHVATKMVLKAEHVEMLKLFEQPLFD